MKKFFGVVMFIAGLVFALVEGARIQRLNIENKTQIENKFMLNAQKSTHEKNIKMIPVNEPVKKSSFKSSM
jgi:hypothetical protein